MKEGKFRKRKFTLAIAVSMVILFILAACGESDRSSQQSGSDVEQKTSKEEQKIKIVAAEDVYGEVAKAVGGDHVTVTSIITGSNSDPHDFEPTPKTAKTVSNASVVIYNGIGYDNWMDQLISSSSKHDKKNTINVGDDVMGKQNGDNPHIWYQPETMPRVSTVLADQLAKIDPKHAEDYRHQASNYQDSLQPFLDLVNKLQQPKLKRIEVTEPVFDYMLNALNYQSNNRNFPLAIEEGTDPAPKDVAQMQNDLKEGKIAFLIENIQVNSPIIDQLVKLAKENDVPIVKVTETLPEGKDYKTWMMDQLKQIKQITNDQ